MSKVKAPLFSLEARGALAKTMVHFPWKGLSCVREYIIPANPKSPAQREQRGKFTESVDMIHLSQRDAYHALGPIDVAAYALLASIFKTPRTWFNAITKAYVDSLVAVQCPLIWQACDLDVSVATQIAVKVYCTPGAPQKASIRYGATKTALLDSKDLTRDEVITVWTANTAVNLDFWIIPTTLKRTGYAYICIEAGTTGATEPAWPTRIGGTIVNGTAKWECLRHEPYLMKGTITGLASGQKYFLQPIGIASEACLGSNGGIYHVIVT